MAQVRVYELAKQFGLESKEVLKQLQGMGEYVRSASSFIEPNVVARVRPLLEQAKVQSPRRHPKPPFTRPGESPPKPSDVAGRFKPAARPELTEEQLLRNLMGSDQAPPARKRHPRSASRPRGNVRHPQPGHVSRTLVEAQLRLIDFEAQVRDLERANELVQFWEESGVPRRRAEQWMRVAPAEADHTLLVGMHSAGFKPQEAFNEFSPSGTGRTTTAYGMVRGGKSPAEVKAIFDLARKRRRGLSA